MSVSSRRSLRKLLIAIQEALPYHQLLQLMQIGLWLILNSEGKFSQSTFCDLSLPEDHSYVSKLLNSVQVSLLTDLEDTILLNEFTILLNELVFILFAYIFLFFRFQEAEDDCTEALNLDDRYIKAYSRRATARKELGKLKESIEGMLYSGCIMVCSYSKAHVFFVVLMSDMVNIANCRF